MKILITGGDGQLAKSFLEVYPKKDLILATKKKLNVTHKSEVEKKISKQKPDFIFHFASITRGEDCAKNPELANKINVEGTQNVVNVAKKLDIPLLFVSTNEVFDGSKKTPYKENDKTNPITVAGITKFKAEEIIKKNLRKYYIVRTSWLYSKWSKNFLYSILKIAKENSKIEVVQDEISSPTYSLDLSHAIEKLIKTNKYGVYNLNNTGSASRLEFAKKAIELSRLKNIKIVPINLSDYKRLSSPPAYTVLDNAKAKKLGIQIPKWESALKRYLKDSNTHAKK